MPMNASRERALNAAGLSLLYPGLGQALQGRYSMAAWYLVDFTGFLIAGLVQPAARGLCWSVAFALGLYAVLDAYRHERHRDRVARAG